MKKNNKIPWLLLLPCLFIIITTVFYPIIKTFLFSLQNYKLTEPYNNKYIGLDNYIKVLKSDEFYSALKNSMILLIFTVIIAFISSMIVGVILNKKSKVSSILTAIAIVPWALPPLANGIIWKFIFYPGYGLMNKVLISLNIIEKPIEWTNSLYTTLFVVSVVVSWKVVPFCAILILSSLQNIPKELYEASKVDGSNRLQEFREITLPLLMPSISIILIQITIASINVFDEVVSITGYKYDSSTLLIYNYMNTFSFLDFGFGSSITYIVMLLSGVIGYFYIRNISRRSYE